MEQKGSKILLRAVSEVQGPGRSGVLVTRLFIRGIDVSLEV